MTIQDLRERALAYGLKKTYEFSVCLDDDLRKKISATTSRLIELYNQRGEKKPEPALAKRITTAEKQLNQLEEQAAPDSVFLRWRRLSPDEYAAIEAASRSDDTYTYLSKLWPLLLEKSFIGAFNSDGENLGITWSQAKKSLLSPGDIDGLSLNLVSFNREQTTIPFDQANYGGHGTS